MATVKLFVAYAGKTGKALRIHDRGTRWW